MKYISLFFLLLSINSLEAKNISKEDLDLHLGDTISFKNIDSRIVYFGGYNTPECKLAISMDGQYFYLTKMESTCEKLINKNNVKIICNSNKTVCKTRTELINFIQEKNQKKESYTTNTNHLSKDVSLFKKLSSIKKPTSYTYSSIHRSDHGLSIWKIIQTRKSIRIYMKATRNDGRIYTRPSVCVKPGFFQCKRWENLLYYIKTNNDNIRLSKITNVKVKSTIIAEAKESIKYERKAQKDRTRARYLLTQKVDKLKGYKEGILTVNDDGGVRQLDISDLSSSKFTLYFPYKGNRLKKFDLREGYDGSWNFQDIQLPNFSDEELVYQNTLLNILKNNEKQLTNLTDEDIQSLVKKYDKYKKVSQYISQILLNKVKNDNNIELRLAKYINDNTAHKQNSIEAIEKLQKLLSEKRNLDLYDKVFKVLNENNPYILPLADDMIKLIWEEAISQSDDIGIVMQFMIDFKEAPGSVISEAYNYALELESKKIKNKFNNMLKDNNGQLSKFDAQERIARRLFIEAVQAKENQNDVEFTIKYHTATNDSLLKETEAAFNLYRDKEMKKIFKQELATLNQNQRESTIGLIQSINSLGDTLETIANNTNIAEQSQKDIDEQNHKFLMQSLIFDRTYRRDDD